MSLSRLHAAMPRQPFGDLLRTWRQRRRMSQMDLAGEADLSTRHLSFLETGKANPSRDMVLVLAEHLGVPPGESNQMLVAAGFAPHFPSRHLDDPAMESCREAMELVLKRHEPFPGIVIDRYWNLIAQNAAVAPLLAGVAPFLLEPPVNVLRLSVHPQGLAPRIAGFSEWAGHLMARLRRDIEITADEKLAALRDELSSYRPQGLPIREAAGASLPPLVVLPLRIDTPAGLLSFIGTTMVFGTPLDVTLSELAIELFFPADHHTSQVMRSIVPAG